MIIKILFAAILSLGLVFAYAHQPVEEHMQMVLDHGIDKYQIHGVSATVIFPDGHSWTGVSGFSHDSVTIKPDMVFGIGSITKNVIAALTLKLAEEKRLSLEDRISKWLPHYAYVDSMITIRQLLNHTSGLYMFWDNQELWDALKEDREKYWSPEEVLQYIKEPCFKPGNGWRYSNTNYLLLAMIINRITGSKLSDELKTHFWQPLGMTDVYLSQEEAIPDNQAHVYGDNFQFGESNIDVTFLPRTSHESITYGSSGIFISSKNLACWSHALFSGQILEAESLDEMLNFIEFNPVANMRAYGLGTQVYDRKFTYGKMAIGHGGGNIGTSTYMLYFPEYHVSIVVMINAFPNRGIDVITRGLIRLVLKDINALSIFPYIDFYRIRFVVFGSVIFWIIVIALHISKKRKLLRDI
jgi:D-alanyl-D-alanine carboxypeptidase